MALGFMKASNSGDGFLPSLRFNAVSGDCVVAGSEKNADGVTWDKFEKEVKFPVKLVADMENIEVGWIYFSAQGPNFALTKIGQEMPAKPSDNHKQGFRLKMYHKDHGLVMFANSSNTVKDVMNEVHDAFMADKDKNVGKLPVLEFKGTEKFQVKTKEGAKNYKKPVIVISGWTSKPEGWVKQESEQSAPAQGQEIELPDDDAF
jgi:hypothetical protein